MWSMHETRAVPATHENRSLNYSGVFGFISVYVAAKKMMGITQIVRGSKYGRENSVKDLKSD